MGMREKFLLIHHSINIPAALGRGLPDSKLLFLFRQEK